MGRMGSGQKREQRSEREGAEDRENRAPPPLTGEGGAHDEERDTTRSRTKTFDGSGRTDGPTWTMLTGNAAAVPVRKASAYSRAPSHWSSAKMPTAAMRTKREVKLSPR